jgi:hypothetical protein
MSSLEDLLMDEDEQVNIRKWKHLGSVCCTFEGWMMHRLDVSLLSPSLSAVSYGLVYSIIGVTSCGHVACFVVASVEGSWWQHTDVLVL